MNNSQQREQLSNYGGVPGHSATALPGARYGQARRHRKCPSVPRMLVHGLLLAALLSACGGDGPSSAAASADSAGPPPGAPHAWSGHYVGTVKIADTAYFGDGVVTADGALRLYVGGPYDGGGGLQLARPASSEQLVGQIQVHDGQWSGDGVVIGQQCADNTASRFCGQPASATASGTVSFDELSGAERMLGEIQVAAASGAETWTVNLLLWIDDGPPGAAGSYTEMLAEFASAGDVVMTLDASGKFFFQSAGTGCVGNGTLGPARAGPGDVYAATLLLESCTGAYAYLNGTYDGLAASTPDSRWDYDAMLRVWLSKPSGETPVAALTMLSGGL